MALFQKKFNSQSTAPLYTVGANRTILIIGLGNPGKVYEGTRHNIGFEIVEEFTKINDFPGWTSKKDLKGEFCVHNIGHNRVVVAKPQTFMNNSGEAAQATQRFYKVYNKDTLVIYDELAIPFGNLRSRQDGTDAGHNGVKSIIQHLGDDFGRLRVGTGKEMSARIDPADFVLQKFNKDEQAVLPSIIKEACAMITEFIFNQQIPNETRKVI